MAEHCHRIEPTPGGAIHHVGRPITPDDLEEVTALAHVVHRQRVEAHQDATWAQLFDGDDLAGLAAREDAATANPADVSHPLATNPCHVRYTEDGIRWICLRDVPCELHGTGDPPHPHGEPRSAAGEGAADGEGAEGGWDRRVIEALIDRVAYTEDCGHPDTCWHCKTAHRQADRDVTNLRALLADRDQLNEALGNEADISLSLEQQRDAAMSEAQAQKTVRRAVAAVLGKKLAAVEAERDAARVVADHWHQAATEHGWADAGHALAMVRGALEGETNPSALGIPGDHPDAAKLDRISKEGTVTEHTRRVDPPHLPRQEV